MEASLPATCRLPGIIPGTTPSCECLYSVGIIGERYLEQLITVLHGLP